MCQMLFMGQTAFIREKKRFKNILAKVLVCAFWGFISACITVVVQTRMFNTPYNGSVLAGVLLIALASLGFSFLGMAIRIGAKHGVDDVVRLVLSVSLCYFQAILFLFLLCLSSFRIWNTGCLTDTL